MLRAELLFLVLDFMEANDIISVMLVISSMFTILKGVEIFPRPSTPKYYLSFFCSLTCSGVTVRFFISNSYWVTS